MQVNDKIHGFRVIRVEKVDEIQATLNEMIHEKTQAKAIWLERADENKTFSIAFKTTPVDDTGVFHILEHSVLNGSRKYPVREPFVDLLKGSLQTFLNAMTFPDKTVYPVSSRNRQDFINLMRVYLDAVFYPLAKEKPYVFYQEGWHYELNDKDEEPIYKGVVFNEMKGAFSSADSMRYRLIMHSLFPDNCYGKESGGDPEHITDLTYEQFCASHDRYYSPDNSYIFLDGDMDIDEILKIIDEEYLDGFDTRVEPVTIEKQAPKSFDTITREYEISEQSDTKGKAQIAEGYVIGSFDEYEKTSAFSLISSVLCGSNESPLKKLILENGYGEDIYFGVQDGILQPYVEIDVINTDLEKQEEIRNAIREKFEEIVKEGLDTEELKANLNQAEFKAKEREFGGAPKGLVFAITALDSWLYGGDPINSLCFDNTFAFLREKIGTSYYEDLIKEYILDSKHSTCVLLKPSNTLGAKKAEKEKEKLAAISKEWTEKEKEDLVSLNKDLTAWQMTPDTPEQKATLPALHLEDLNEKPTEYPAETYERSGVTVISHGQETNGISYVSLHIKNDDLTLEECTVLGQMLMLMGQLKTEKYDALTLNRMMKSILGEFSASYTPRNRFHDGSEVNYSTVSFSSLHRNDEEAVDLVKEILY
ncbi:MAG: insulinase family protein, partial [Erysipelotrichaceae bacterium]|nr:insulinase family protein [Erysipelotrichaceae bacterium]